MHARVRPTPNVPPIGFSGSLHQKFNTLEEANQFISTVQEQGSSQPLYAVRKGRRPGIYTDWGTCKNQVYSTLPTPRYRTSLFIKVEQNILTQSARNSSIYIKLNVGCRGKIMEQ